MTHLRLTSPSNDNWTRQATATTWAQNRYAPLPPRRRGGGLLLGLVVMPLAVGGLWLILGAPEISEPVARPLVFQVPHPSEPGAPNAPSRGLKIVLANDARPASLPETWGALPTAVGAPVAATPLADVVPADQTAECEAATLTAQMTCVDPTLREAERRMTLAYDAVLAAGVVPADLGRSQARWLATRDEAARSSPEDLLAAYQLREEQLRNFALALMRKAGSVGLKQDVSGDQPRAFTGAAPST